MGNTIEAAEEGCLNTLPHAGSAQVRLRVRRPVASEYARERAKKRAWEQNYGKPETQWADTVMMTVTVCICVSGGQDGWLLRYTWKYHWIAVLFVSIKKGYQQRLSINGAHSPYLFSAGMIATARP